MIRLEVIFVMQIIMAMLMLLFLQKITQLKKQIDEIVIEVENYLEFISEEEKKESKPNVKRKSAHEEQNRLIQAVLSEYFP